MKVTYIILIINLAEIIFMHSTDSLILWLGYFIYWFFKED